MLRSSLFALALAAAAASCASTSEAPRASLSGSSSASTPSSSSATAPSAPTATPQAAPSTPVTPATPTGEYTDAQVQGFIAASAEINPIVQASSGNPSPAQIEQIRAALTRHQLTSEIYNAIAARGRTDTVFAARVEALRTAQPSTAAPATGPQ